MKLLIGTRMFQQMHVMNDNVHLMLAHEVEIPRRLAHRKLRVEVCVNQSAGPLSEKLRI
jgi:hypothetical protein